jgi:hypothetical protein
VRLLDLHMRDRKINMSELNRLSPVVNQMQAVFQGLRLRSTLADSMWLSTFVCSGPVRLSMMALESVYWADKPIVAKDC